MSRRAGWIIRSVHVATCVAFAVSTIVVCAETWGAVVPPYRPDQSDCLVFWTLASLCWAGAFCYDQYGSAAPKQLGAARGLLSWTVHAAVSICVVDLLPSVLVLSGTHWLGAFLLLMEAGVVIAAILSYETILDFRKKNVSVGTFARCVSLVCEGVVIAWIWSLFAELIAGV